MVPYLVTCPSAHVVPPPLVHSPLPEKKSYRLQGLYVKLYSKIPKLSKIFVSGDHFEVVSISTAVVGHCDFRCGHFILRRLLSEVERSLRYQSLWKADLLLQRPLLAHQTLGIFHSQQTAGTFHSYGVENGMTLFCCERCS